MGFLGFGNYSKEGPGVRKNEPEKKRFFKYWEIFGQKFWGMMTLNLLYLVCCIPVVTIGPATAGFVYVMRNYILGRPVFLKDDFFDAFKTNWKQSAIVWFGSLIVGAIDAFAIVFYFSGVYSNAPQDTFFQIFGFVGLAVTLSLMIILVFMNFYLYPMMVSFDFKLKPLLKNALIFAGLGMKVNLLNLLWIAIFLAIGLAFFFFPYTIPFGIFYFIFLTAPFIGSVVVFNTFPLIREYVIDPYYEKEGIPNPLDPVYDNEEALFEDDVTQRENRTDQ